jgi:hypothetical protein
MTDRLAYVYADLEGTQHLVGRRKTVTLSGLIPVT